MSDIFDNMLETMKASSDEQQAAIEAGVKIGRREMRTQLYPLIRELIDAVDGLAPDDGEDREESEELIARAGRILDETAAGRENAP